MFRKIDKKYWYLFLTVCACILFYYLVSNIVQVWSVVQWFFRLISPILYGFAITYVLTPLCNALFKLSGRVFPRMKAKGKRVLSVTLTYVVVLLVLSAILLVIVPQTVESISTILSNFSEYTRTFSAFMKRISDAVDNAIPGAFSHGNPFEMLQNAISRYGPEVLSSFPDAVSRITAVVGDIVFGLLISVYMLYDKELLIARVKKLMYAVVGEEKGKQSVLFAREINETVGSFINEKLIASLALGLVSYVLFLLFGIEFPGLLAAISGVTNIIPVFGPIIGAVLCALILLIVAPRHVIGFLVIILILQQIEGNIISPRIMGRITGVSGFWVMICLVIGEGLFGIMGMILSVPLFAIVYRLLTDAVNANLNRRSLTVDTDYYRDNPPRVSHEESPKKREPIFRIKLPFFGKNKEKNTSADESQTVEHQDETK